MNFGPACPGEFVGVFYLSLNSSTGTSIRSCSISALHQDRTTTYQSWFPQTLNRAPTAVDASAMAAEAMAWRGRSQAGVVGPSHQPSLLEGLNSGAEMRNELRRSNFSRFEPRIKRSRIPQTMSILIRAQQWHHRLHKKDY